MRTVALRGPRVSGFPRYFSLRPYISVKNANDDIMCSRATCEHQLRVEHGTETNLVTWRAMMVEIVSSWKMSRQAWRVPCERCAQPTRHRTTYTPWLRVQHTYNTANTTNHGEQNVNKRKWCPPRTIELPVIISILKALSQTPRCWTSVWRVILGEGRQGHYATIVGRARSANERCHKYTTR